MIPEAIQNYNNALSSQEQDICNTLARIINEFLLDAEKKFGMLILFGF